MGHKVKIDEDLSPLLLPILSHHGCEPFTVNQQGWGGMKDPELWQKISAERIYFITGDKGFGDIRIYPPGTHAGIAILRPARESVLAYLELLERFLSRHRLESLFGTVSVVSPSGIRMRRPKD